jgi:hypothetical protein
MLMPEQLYGVVKGKIQASPINDDWAELTECIPEL